MVAVCVQVVTLGKDVKMVIKFICHHFKLFSQLILVIEFTGCQDEGKNSCLNGGRCAHNGNCIW
jgi:hypothetical protein